MAILTVLKGMDLVGYLKSKPYGTLEEIYFLMVSMLLGLCPRVYLTPRMISQKIFPYTGLQSKICEICTTVERVKHNSLLSYFTLFTVVQISHILLCSPVYGNILCEIILGVKYTLGQSPRSIETIEK